MTDTDPIARVLTVAWITTIKWTLTGKPVCDVNAVRYKWRREKSRRGRREDGTQVGAIPPASTHVSLTRNKHEDNCSELEINSEIFHR